MTLNVLIVDDSQFFQHRLSEIIGEHPQFNVVGFADNGNQALSQVKKLKPDVVTMDYEMPMMNGVTAVRTIMAECPVPILMLSSMTYEGARITLEALEAGAADFMTKNFSEISNKSPAIKKRLYDVLLAIGQGNKTKKSTVVKTDRYASLRSPSGEHTMMLKHASPPKNSLYETEDPPKIVAIGSSTGGPAALLELLKKVPRHFPLPIILIQHMPENFTLAFAERLNNQCAITVKQAEQGDELRPGVALLAPGGKQLIIDKKKPSCIKIIDSTDAVNYRPCVDITFASLSNTYAQHTLAIVLTGMGHDGCDGARLLKQQRATVWTQDKASCVIYGMPMAIDKAGLSNASFNLDCIAKQLAII